MGSPTPDQGTRRLCSEEGQLQHPFVGLCWPTLGSGLAFTGGLQGRVDTVQGRELCDLGQPRALSGGGVSPE